MRNIFFFIIHGSPVKCQCPFVRLIGLYKYLFKAQALVMGSNVANKGFSNTSPLEILFDCEVKDIGEGLGTIQLFKLVDRCARNNVFIINNRKCRELYV